MMSASFEYYRNVLTEAEQNKPSRLKMSTLALGGEKGVGANLCNGLKSHADSLEGGVTSGKGHYLPEECPEELSKRILAFFRDKE